MLALQKTKHLNYPPIWAPWKIIPVVTGWGRKDATSIKREEARDAAKCSTIHRTAPQQKLSALKGQ